MAVISVPPPLQERLGSAAAESLAELLQQLEVGQEHQRRAQKEHLIELLEERFLRHVIESENRLRNELRAEMEAGFTRQQEQISELGAELGNLRAEFGKELGSVRVEIGNVQAEFGKELGSVRAELGNLRAEFGKELGSVRAEIGNVRAEFGKEIAAVHKAITIQTRWILVVFGAAAVLYPIIQRVITTLLP